MGLASKLLMDQPPQARGSLGLLTWLFERPLGKVLGRDLEDRLWAASLF